MSTSDRLGVWVTAIVMAACVPSKPGDSEAVEPSPAPAPPEARSVEAPPSEDPAAEPAIEPGPSTIPAKKRIVAKTAQPGLVQFADEMFDKGSVWIGPLEGNGGRDVLVYIPPGADNDADVHLVYHFHGTYSEHIEKQQPDMPKKRWVGWNRLAQTFSAAGELQRRRNYNVALVYPISAGKRREPGLTGWNNKAYDRMWMDPADPPTFADSFDKMHDEVVELLQKEFGVHPSKLTGRVIAEGHSAGGIALLNIARRGSPHVGEYLFMDASFQGWADGCYEAVKESGSGARITLVITEDGIADPFGKRDPWCTKLEADAGTWRKERKWCSSNATKSPSSSVLSCKELEARAEEWDDYDEWCAGMKVDMKNTPGVHVHRTRVYHAKQPTHFTGGLELRP